ncbi:MAG: radical SAM protein [Elusimicrobiota bacterium]
MEYGNMPKDQKIEWIKSLTPNTAIWEITLKCNMRCIHCGSTAGPDTRLLDELNTKEAIDLVHQLAEIGTKRIVFSGGEPFIRGDWPLLAKEAAVVGIMPSFISNGYMLDEKVAGQIAELKKINELTHVGLSLDGTEKIHDHLRQISGSYKRVLRAMKALRKEGILMSVVSTVSKFNIKVLPQMMDVVFGHDAWHWQLQMATPWGRFTRDMMLDTEEYMYMLYFLAEQKEKLGNKINGADDCGYYTYLEDKLRPQGTWSGCHAGVRTIGLRSNGDVMGCLSLQEEVFIEGNIREKKLRDFWYDPDAFSYNRNFVKSDLKGFCGTCPNGLVCRGGCKNTAYSITRDPAENLYCAFKIMMEDKDGITKDPKKLKEKIYSSTYTEDNIKSVADEVLPAQ